MMISSEKIVDMINYQVTINGISVAASYSEKAVDEIFLPLLRKLTEIYTDGCTEHVFEAEVAPDQSPIVGYDPEEK